MFCGLLGKNHSYAYWLFFAIYVFAHITRLFLAQGHLGLTYCACVVCPPYVVGSAVHNPYCGAGEHQTHTHMQSLDTDPDRTKPGYTLITCLELDIISASHGNRVWRPSSGCVSVCVPRVRAAVRSWTYGWWSRRSRCLIFNRGVLVHAVVALIISPSVWIVLTQRGYKGPSPAPGTVAYGSFRSKKWREDCQTGVAGKCEAYLDSILSTSQWN